MDRQILENIFVTAIDGGGSGYWCYINARNHRAVRRAVSHEDESDYPTAILKAILDHGVSVEINDAENEDDILGVFTAETIKQRLEELANDEGLSYALEAEIDEDGDAETSDVVFQYLLFGELIFS
jgi:hypothetical protein